MKKLVLVVAFALLATFSTPASADAFYVPGFDFSNIFSRAQRFQRIDVDADYKKSTDTVRMTFTELEDAESISYQLTYFNNRQYEAVVGTTDVEGEDKIVKEVFLGTCSDGGNCTPHENVKWLILRVDTEYQNGKSETRIYPVK